MPNDPSGPDERDPARAEAAEQVMPPQRRSGAPTLPHPHRARAPRQMKENAMYVVGAYPSSAGQHLPGPPETARTAPYGSILETIGHTPIVRLNNIGPGHVDLYAKLEAFNPMGSVKDRLAAAVIDAAERTGDLRPGQTVIESTSGNTGLGLAMVCAQKGYPLVIVMAENFSVERRKLLRFLGAKVILTPAALRGTGMFALAERLAEAHGWYLCRQFENEANAEAHTATTAREILADFGPDRLDYWVTGFGTGGTLKGVARVLKAESPATRIVAVEPENSQILNSGIAQRRRPDGAPARSHPNARAHPVQGWSPDFIPKLAGDCQAAGFIDRYAPVSGHAALFWARELARKEGIFCGISGGATLAAAIDLAETADPGARILAMVPDTGERYLSTPLFEDIPEVMTDEEREIAASVPPITRAPAKPRQSTGEPLDPDAVAFVEDTIASSDHPIVMFGFEWCEFCWSVRRIFKQAGIPLRSVDVDAAEFRGNEQVDDWGGKILRAVFAKTGKRTVPQVFVGGTCVGGASEVLTGFEDRSLHAHLARLDPPRIPGAVSDPLSFLPSWVVRPQSKTGS
ncbi:MAG: pyridoxal-phosphate dependent enzyme [Pseudomonadota bacterium]